MKKIISFVGLFAVMGAGVGDAHGVAMSAQVRRLLQEKQEKIEQLEKCEGKKQGWMIAGISTIGLTAVGVGVNIAQASKSNRLSDEIEMEKSTLERHENELNRIQNDIAAERARQAEENKCCDMKRRCCECEKLNNGNCPGDGDDGVTAYDYSKYKLDCDHDVSFSFVIGTSYSDVLERLNAECRNVTGKDMKKTENGVFVRYECENYKIMANCGKQQNECPDIKYYLPLYSQGPDYMAKIDAKLEKYKTDCSNSGGDWSVVEKQSNLIGVGTTYICKGRKICKSGEEVEIMVVVDTDVNPVTPVKPDRNCRTSHGKKPTTDCPCDGDKGLLDFGHGKCECKPGEEWNDKKCVVKVVNPVKPETSLQKCLRERKDDRVGTACCYLSRSVATYEKGACVCVGKGKTFEIDKDGHGLCIDVQPDVVGPERVLNMPCVEDDLQHPAKTGVYVNNGELLCKGLPSVDVATYPCSCKITSCSDGFHVSNKNNGCEDNCPGNNQKWDKSTQKCYDVSCVLGANRIGASACKCMDGLKREELADGRVKCIDEFEEGSGRNIPFRPFE